MPWSRYMRRRRSGGGRGGRGRGRGDGKGHAKFFFQKKALKEIKL